MMPNAILATDPEYRPQQAGKLLGCCARTISRYSHLGKFPAPDDHEWYKGRWVPVWKLSTLKAYRETRLKRAE